VTFYDPIFLLLLPALLLIVWRWWRSAQTDSIAYSAMSDGWKPGRTWRQHLLWLPPVLTFVALALMILSLARPRHGRQRTIVNSEGIAIEMVIDRSGSMQALDFRIDGQPVDRLTAVKNVASKFIVGNRDSSDGDLPGRISDLVGLIVFAGYADAVSPPTLDQPFLVSRIDRTQIVEHRNEDGTAIGDAISLAVGKLCSLSDRQTEKVKEKIIILLTDGENTAGEIEPKQAAELAESKGIKVYTIGVGTKGRAPFPIRRLPDGRIQVEYIDVNIDEETLRMIADRTGGKYFRATDTNSLVRTYEEIDQLEKTKVDSQTFFDYRELAVQDSPIGGYRIPALLLIAMLALAARMILERVVLRQAA
jgi:Ca-activated chloride channel family protein